jgi:ketosteroid isomerase-like protein
MWQENVEMVRRSIAAIDSRELCDETYETLCTPDFSLTNAPTAVTDKTYYGAPEPREWVAEFTEAFGAGVRYEVEEVRADDEDFVVATPRLSGQGARSAAPLVLSWVGVWWFRDGKVSRAAGYTSRREAFKAVGLEE